MASSTTKIEELAGQSPYREMCEVTAPPYTPGAVHLLHPPNRLAEGEEAVVLDVDWPVQVGWAQDAGPRGVFPPLVGRPRDDGRTGGRSRKDTYVGDEARVHRGILAVRVPLERGMVVDWDDYEKIVWHSFYQELRTAPETSPVILLESPGMSADARQRVGRILMETFRVPALSVINRPVAAVCAAGGAVGVNLHLGRTHSWVVPVVDGYALAYAARALPYGRRMAADSLLRLLATQGQVLTSYYDRDVVEDMLQLYGHVAPGEGEAGPEDTQECTHELPDGKVVTLGSARWQAWEGLFHPTMWEQEGALSVVEAVCESVRACDGTLRALLLRHVVVSGVSVKGLEARLQKELRCQVGWDVEVTVTNPPDALSLPWLGASVCGTLGVHYVTAAAYEEHGPTLFHGRQSPFPFNGDWEE